MSKRVIKRSGRQRVVIFSTHLLCLMILFVLPEVLLNYGREHAHNDFITYAKSTVFVLTFYVEYYGILGREYTRKTDLWRFILSNLLLIIAAMTAIFCIIRLAPFPGIHRFENPDLVLLRRASFLLKELCMIILTISLAVALNISERWLKTEAARKEEMSVRQKQELVGLRNQLNPHFLFNTLNSIYALIEINPATARDAVHELSKLLRYVLYENPSFVELGKEADFIEHYVALQRLRLPVKAEFSLDVDINGCSDALVPPMLFVTLVENVFKHADFSAPAKLSLLVSEGKAICTTENKQKNYASDHAPGIGLANLQRRIELLFGSDASLATSELNDFFTVTLTVPLKHRQNNNDGLS